MFDKLNLLAIAVSGINDSIIPPEPSVVDDKGVNAFWTIVLIAIIVICLLLSKYIPNVVDSLKKGKKNSEQKKMNKQETKNRNVSIKLRRKTKENS